MGMGKLWWGARWHERGKVIGRRIFWLAVHNEWRTLTRKTQIVRRRRDVWGQRSPEQGHGHHVEAVGGTLGRTVGQGGGWGPEHAGLSHKGWRGGGGYKVTSGADHYSGRERGKRGDGRERRRGGGSGGRVWCENFGTQVEKRWEFRNGPLSDRPTL